MGDDRKFYVVPRDMILVGEDGEMRIAKAGTSVELPPPTPPRAPGHECGCYTCWRARNPTAFRHMILCPSCGNKRCPHATDHTYACTGSNEPGQPGSAY